MIVRKESAHETNREGMTLMEALVAMALVAIALLGLAQMFTYSLMINARSERISTATFLAQQQIDHLRSLTQAELSALSGDSLAEPPIDVNRDGTDDYRRITILQPQGLYWGVTVYVFGPEQLSAEGDDLIDDPVKHHVLARMETIIGR
jgi:type II secretory pathway pseudopilin PulG